MCRYFPSRGQEEARPFGKKELPVRVTHDLIEDERDRESICTQVGFTEIFEFPTRGYVVFELANFS